MISVRKVSTIGPTPQQGHPDRPGDSLVVFMFDVKARRIGVFQFVRNSVATRRIALRCLADRMALPQPLKDIINESPFRGGNFPVLEDLGTLLEGSLGYTVVRRVEKCDETTANILEPWIGSRQGHGTSGLLNTRGPESKTYHAYQKSSKYARPTQAIQANPSLTASV
jgi:hypothetical protein